MKNNNIEAQEAPAIATVYTDCKGTGVLSSIIFAILTIILMMILAFIRG